MQTECLLDPLDIQPKQEEFRARTVLSAFWLELCLFSFLSQGELFSDLGLGSLYCWGSGGATCQTCALTCHWQIVRILGSPVTLPLRDPRCPQLDMGLC